MTKLAEVASQDAEVGGVNYQVIVEVRRLHSTLPKLVLEPAEVGDVDYIVSVGVTTPLCAELLAGVPSGDNQVIAIGRR